MLQKGSIVMILDTKSCFNNMLGSIGIVKDVFDTKAMVLFKGKVKKMGTLSHSVNKSDLKEIGQITDEKILNSIM